MNAKYKKITAFCFLTILLALIFAVSAEAKNNIALECKIDSVCGESGENKSASMLVDDDPNYNTKWEVSDITAHPGEPHWVILDFGTERTFDSIRLIKASQGSEDFGRTEFDADEFRFEISSDKKSWVKICGATDDGGRDIYEGNFTPATARYLKLIITQPENDEKSSTENENQAVRFYDLKVFEYIPIIEEDNEAEETSVTESAPAHDDTLTSPKTFDSAFLASLLAALVIIIFAITRIFLSPRSRSV